MNDLERLAGLDETLNIIPRFRCMSSMGTEIMTFPDDVELAVALYMADTGTSRPTAIERLVSARLKETRYLRADGTIEHTFSAAKGDKKPL